MQTYCCLSWTTSVCMVLPVPIQIWQGQSRSIIPIDVQYDWQAWVWLPFEQWAPRLTQGIDTHRWTFLSTKPRPLLIRHPAGGGGPPEPPPDVWRKWKGYIDDNWWRCCGNLFYIRYLIAYDRNIGSQIPVSDLVLELEVVEEVCKVERINIASFL